MKRKRHEIRLWQVRPLTAAEVDAAIEQRKIDFPECCYDGDDHHMTLHAVLFNDDQARWVGYECLDQELACIVDRVSEAVAAAVGPGKVGR